MAAKPRQLLGEHFEMLPVKLTREELLERGQNLGNKHEEMSKHLDAATLQKKVLQKKEDELQQEIERLAHMLRTGCEPRKTKVEAYANFTRMRFEAIRTDTGDIVHERPLREAEKQGQLDDDWSRQLHLALVKVVREPPENEEKL